MQEFSSGQKGKRYCYERQSVINRGSRISARGIGHRSVFAESDGMTALQLLASNPKDKLEWASLKYR